MCIHVHSHKTAASLEWNWWRKVAIKDWCNVVSEAVSKGVKIKKFLHASIDNHVSSFLFPHPPQDLGNKHLPPLEQNAGINPVSCGIFSQFLTLAVSCGIFSQYLTSAFFYYYAVAAFHAPSLAGQPLHKRGRVWCYAYTRFVPSRPGLWANQIAPPHGVVQSRRAVHALPTTRGLPVRQAGPRGHIHERFSTAPHTQQSCAKPQPRYCYPMIT